MTPTEPRGGEGLKRFPDDVKDVQSRFVIIHQLRASADIQDAEITRTMGRKATTDRAALMREAADALERLLSRPPIVHGWPEREDEVERLSKVYAEATGYYVQFHRGLSSPSSDEIRKGIRAVLAALPAAPLTDGVGG